MNKTFQLYEIIDIFQENETNNVAMIISKTNVHELHLMPLKEFNLFEKWENLNQKIVPPFPYHEHKITLVNGVIWIYKEAHEIQRFDIRKNKELTPYPLSYGRIDQMVYIPKTNHLWCLNTDFIVIIDVNTGKFIKDIRIMFCLFDEMIYDFNGCVWLIGKETMRFNIYNFTQFHFPIVPCFVNHVMRAVVVKERNELWIFEFDNLHHLDHYMIKFDTLILNVLTIENEPIRKTPQKFTLLLYHDSISLYNIDNRVYLINKNYNYQSVIVFE